MRLFLFLAIAIAVLTILFALQNADPVLIHFGIWVVESPLALILLITLGIGFVVGLLVSMPAILARGWKSSSRKRTIQALEDELIEKEQQLADQKKRIEFLEHNLPSPHPPEEGSTY